MPFSEPPSRWRRRDVVLLVLLGVLHAWLLVGGVTGALAQHFAMYEPLPYLRIGLGSLATAAVVVGLGRRRPAAAALGLVLLVAAALLTPGPVIVVALWLLNALVIGRLALRSLGLHDELRGPVPVLTGVALWIGAIAATAAMKIHYAPVYVIALLLPLGIAWRETAAAVADLRGSVLAHDDAASPLELAWAVLLSTVVILHVFVVAQPEVGYDANTMHLQVPLALANAHRFSFDVTHRAWAVMPLGADWAFAAVYMVGGEAAARLANLCFGALAGAVIYAVVRASAPRSIALASVTLLATTPLAFLETGSLFVENLWLAFLLAALWIALRHARDAAPGALVAFALLAAGALQCKVIGAVWIAPVLLGLLVAWRKVPLPRDARAATWLLVAIVIALWPYANAWLRTGNPVFPYLNAVFRAPAFDTAANFANAIYTTPLTPASFYDALLHSHRYIEGRDGAAGFHWLLLLPVLAVALLRTSRRAPWALLALGAFFFVVVFAQQSYLRYLLPVFALLAVLGGWALGTLPPSRATGAAIIVVAAVLGAVQLRLIDAGSWTHARLCPRCGFDPAERDDFIATFMPDRLVGETLNRLLPAGAKLGFFMPNAPGPAGYLGPPRLANWHDPPVFAAVVAARSPDDLQDIARRYELTHVVCREPPEEDDTPAVRAFCRTRLTPIWQAHGRLVGAVRPSGQ